MSRSLLAPVRVVYWAIAAQDSPNGNAMIMMTRFKFRNSRYSYRRTKMLAGFYLVGEAGQGEASPQIAQLPPQMAKLLLQNICQ